MSTSQTFVLDPVAIVPSSPSLGKRSSSSDFSLVYDEPPVPPLKRACRPIVCSFGLDSPPLSALPDLETTSALDLFFTSACTGTPVSASSMMQSSSMCEFTVDERPTLIIKDQPEEYYRPRYGCEGLRGPLKGLNENYISVQVIGKWEYGGIVDVKLVHEDGTSHISCSLDCSEERRNALTKKIGPHNNMTAEFNDLRIRREKKPPKDGRRPIKSAAKLEGHDDKVGHLLFTATLSAGPGKDPLVLTSMSSPIILTTPPDAAALEWVHPVRGHFHGNEDIVIKGSKMTAPKVTFHIQMPNGQRFELPGMVQKDKSHQNVLMVKTPALPRMLAERSGINAHITVTNGKSAMNSNALQFTYIPDAFCCECMSKTNLHQQQGGGRSPTSIPYPSLSPPPMITTASSLGQISVLANSTPLTPQPQLVQEHEPIMTIGYPPVHSPPYQPMMTTSQAPTSSASEIPEILAEFNKMPSQVAIPTTTAPVSPPTPASPVIQASSSSSFIDLGEIPGIYFAPTSPPVSCYSPVSSTDSPGHQDYSEALLGLCSPQPLAHFQATFIPTTSQ